jgi:hypothetical protein
VKKSYQGTEEKSKRKFEVIGKRELLVEMPVARQNSVRL